MHDHNTHHSLDEEYASGFDSNLIREFCVQ